MMTFNKFMSKLKKIDFTESNGDREITSKDGFKLSYRIEVSTMTAPTVRIVFYLRYKDQHLTQWGCIEESENKDFLVFFEKAQHQIYKAKRVEDQQLEEEGLEIFKNL